MKRPLLILGSSGQIGGYLKSLARSDDLVITPTRSEVSLENSEALVRYVGEKNPRGIINAAAYTNVEKAESESELAVKINSVAPGVLAREAKKIGAWFVHYSTDYVFNGKKVESYVESDPVDPQNVYGRSKLLGEEAIQEAGGKFLILRTSWIYGLSGHNFFKTMLRLSREREEIKVVNDQLGCPTSSRSVAETTFTLIRKFIDHSEVDSAHFGLYHLAASGSTSWYSFAEKIFELDPNQREQKLKTLVAISSSEFPSAVTRPKNSVLACEKLETTFGLRLTSWEDQLRSVFSTAQSGSLSFGDLV